MTGNTNITVGDEHRLGIIGARSGNLFTGEALPGALAYHADRIAGLSEHHWGPITGIFVTADPATLGKFRLWFTDSPEPRRLTTWYTLLGDFSTN